jgi:hypothetical protein
LPGANTLAYLASLLATKKKSFITLTPGVSVTKLLKSLTDTKNLALAVVPWQAFPALSITCGKDRSLPYKGELRSYSRISGLAVIVCKGPTRESLEKGKAQDS